MVTVSSGKILSMCVLSHVSVLPEMPVQSNEAPGSWDEFGGVLAFVTVQVPDESNTYPVGMVSTISLKMAVPPLLSMVMVICPPQVVKLL